MQRGICLIMTLLLFVMPIKAQQNTDSAAIIINKYLDNLNYDNLNWKTVDIRSVITNTTSHDTIFLIRRFAFPSYSFVELTYKNKILEGLFSDGTTFLQYDTTEHAWVVSSQSRYEEVLLGYDIRGPLYNWQNRKVGLIYQGISMLDSNEVYQISAKDPDRGFRNYLFERSSNNLFLIVEHQSNRNKNVGVDWRAIHEYTPVGEYIFPTLESYQYNGSITIIRSEIELKPFDKKQFPKP